MTEFNYIETTIQELAEKWEYFIFNEEHFVDANNWIKHDFGKAEGFRINKGKKLYHFITPSPSGFYYAYPDGEGVMK